MTLRTRVRLESAVAILTTMAAILTAAVPSWIEAIFGIDPDAGNGAVEWGVTIAFAAVTLVVVRAARSTSRRLHARSAAMAVDEA